MSSDNESVRSLLVLSLPMMPAMLTTMTTLAHEHEKLRLLLLFQTLFKWHPYDSTNFGCGCIRSTGLATNELTGKMHGILCKMVILLIPWSECTQTQCFVASVIYHRASGARHSPNVMITTYCQPKNDVRHGNEQISVNDLTYIQSARDTGMTAAEWATNKTPNT